MVRAKVTCDALENGQVTLRPIMDNSTEENKRFTRYTPGGKLELLIENPAALEQFEVGKQYYVDFTPVEA